MAPYANSHPGEPDTHVHTHARPHKLHNMGRPRHGAAVQTCRRAHGLCVPSVAVVLASRSLSLYSWLQALRIAQEPLRQALSFPCVRASSWIYTSGVQGGSRPDQAWSCCSGLSPRWATWSPPLSLASPHKPGMGRWALHSWAPGSCRRVSSSLRTSTSPGSVSFRFLCLLNGNRCLSHSQLYLQGPQLTRHTVGTQSVSSIG